MNRKKLKEDVVYAQMSQHFREVEKELIENLPYRMIKIHELEADDVISILCQKIEGNHVIISNDKDFIQLTKLDNIKLYSPMKDSFMSVDDVEYFIFEHIIRGDSSDGITNVLSDNDCLVNPDKRQKPIFEKKIKEWYVNKDEIINDEKFKNNEKIIDLFKIPEEYYEQVLGEFGKENKNTKQKLFQYLISKKLTKLSENLQNF
jgi:hypothetical protein